MSRHHDAMTERLGDNPGFIVTLEVAVPLWAHRWAGRPVAARMARANGLGQFVAHHGDRILYRHKGGKPNRIPAQEPSGGWQTVGRTHAPPDTVIPNPSSAEVFNALAEGIGILSLHTPGGVNLFGRHWHHGCPATTPWPDDCIDLAPPAA